MPEEGSIIPTSVVYYHDIDLGTNQLLNARLHPIDTASRTAMASSLNSGDEGLTVYDTDVDTFYVWNGNQWLQVGLTQTQIQYIQEAYNRSVMAVDVSRTETTETVKLTYRDSTFISDSVEFSYIHTQTAASSTWNITHNLGKYPAVSIVDTGGNEVIGEVVYNNNNSVSLQFSAPFSGKAYFN